MKITNINKLYIKIIIKHYYFFLFKMETYFTKSNTSTLQQETSYNFYEVKQPIYNNIWEMLNDVIQNNIHHNIIRPNSPLTSSIIIEDEQ